MATQKNMKRNRLKRRESAIKLLAERDKRSDREQLAIINTRPGESKKEKTRILNQPDYLMDLK